MNPFEAFEKNASAAGLSTAQIETLKKEALASVNPEQKEKVAAEQSYSNYTEGFVKAAADYGVSAKETQELFKIANTVKVETLPAAIKTHFGHTNEKTASEKAGQTTANFVIGFAKTAQAYGLKGEQTVALLEKQGFDLEAIKAYLQNEQNAPTIGAGAGALGGAGLGAMMGGEGGRAKGALGGAAAGGLAGYGLGHAHQQGGQMKEQDASALRGQQSSPFGAALTGGFSAGMPGKTPFDVATNNGALGQQAEDVEGQSNIGAYLRNLMGSKPYAAQGNR